MNFEPLQPKFAAFGWSVQRVDGNDLDALVAAFDQARDSDWPGPQLIIRDTRMGRGVPFLEARERNHFLNVAADEWRRALDVLDASRPA